MSAGLCLAVLCRGKELTGEDAMSVYGTPFFEDPHGGQTNVVFYGGSVPSRIR
jgi:prepilin-type processing-associated H-X9-DG protein